MTQSLTTSQSDSNRLTDRHCHCVPGRRAWCSNHAGPGCASAHHPSQSCSGTWRDDYDRAAATCHGTLAVTVTDSESGSLGLTRIVESRAVDCYDSEAFKLTGAAWHDNLE